MVTNRINTEKWHIFQTCYVNTKPDFDTDKWNGDRGIFIT